MDSGSAALAQTPEQRFYTFEAQQQGLGTGQVVIDLGLTVRAFQSDHLLAPFSTAKFAVKGWDVVGNEGLVSLRSARGQPVYSQYGRHDISPRLRKSYLDNTSVSKV